MGQLPTSGPASAAYFLSPHWSIDGGKEGRPNWLSSMGLDRGPARRPPSLYDWGWESVHPHSLQGDASAQLLATSGHNLATPGNIIVTAGSHIFCDVPVIRKQNWVYLSESHLNEEAWMCAYMIVNVKKVSEWIKSHPDLIQSPWKRFDKVAWTCDQIRMREHATLDNLLEGLFSSASFQHLCLSLCLSLSDGLIGIGKDPCNRILDPMIQFWLPPQRLDSKFHRLFICPNTPRRDTSIFQCGR